MIKIKTTYKYILHNWADESAEKFKLKVIKPCDITIYYGDKNEIVHLVENDKIWWDTNVIISHENNNLYKSTVSTKQLTICSENDSLEKIPYISTQKTQCFTGSHNWDAICSNNQ